MAINSNISKYKDKKTLPFNGGRNNVYYIGTLEGANKKGLSKNLIFLFYYIKSRTDAEAFRETELNQFIKDFYLETKGTNTEFRKIKQRLFDTGLARKYKEDSVQLISKIKLCELLEITPFKSYLDGNGTIEEQIVVRELSLRLDRRDSYSKIQSSLKKTLSRDDFALYNKIKSDSVYVKALPSRFIKHLTEARKTVNYKRELSYAYYAKKFGYSPKKYKEIMKVLDSKNLIEFHCGKKRRGTKLFHSNCRFDINEKISDLYDNGTYNIENTIVRVSEKEYNGSNTYFAIAYDTISYSKSIVIIKSDIGYSQNRILR